MRFNHSRFTNRAKISLACLFILFSGFFASISPAQAMTVSVAADAPATVNTVKQTLWQKITKALLKAGGRALQSVTRSALNKVAYDAADWAASGGEGQQPLFVTKGWGDYLTQIGDEAAGQFIENFADSFAGDIQAEQKRGRDTKNCETQQASCYDGCQAAADWATNGEKCAGDCLSRYDTCAGTASANYSNALANNGKAAATGAKTSSLNLCAPSLDIRMKLAIGLVNQQRPSRPNCAWSDMSKNWTNAIEASKSADYYGKLRNMFDSQSSDLGAALTLQTGIMEDVGVKTDTGKTTLVGKGGWIDPVGVGGKAIGLPDQAKTKQELAQQGYVSNVGKFTGDALMDAANVFLNQLASKGFEKLINSLKGGVASNADGSYPVPSDNINDPNAPRNRSYSSSANQAALMSILKPQFEQRADYNVLADMAICPDEANPGPSNCVIDNKMMEAISERKTIGEALKDGSLNGSWLMTADSKVSAYQENYSLRNAMILRKYRILPVGWEAAIEKASALGKIATLADLVSCFSANDSFHTFSSPALENSQDWCRGLVDPNWVLKAPQSYCAKSGFGNQIISSQINPTSDIATGSPSSELMVTRADGYCADEKTCIQEDSKGSCQAYGYCTEDRRTWNFGGDSCDPIYNSCQTFSGPGGASVSYLKDTLDYSTCADSNSGCLQYSTFGSYDFSSDKISWSGNNAYSIFLNGKADTCAASSEGCRSLVRVKPSWGDNLIFNNDLSLLNSRWQVLGSSTAMIENAALANGTTNPILKFSNTGYGVGVVSSGANSVIPENAGVIDGYYYTLTAEVYLPSSDTITLKLGGSDYVSETMSETGAWQVISLTAKPSDGISSLDFSITSNNDSTFYLRNIKLEANNYFSGWSSYGATTAQEKLIPGYLEALCYQNPFAAGLRDYRLKDYAPAICDKFARRCNKDEVGCQTFTSQDGFSVTGKVNFDEYCPQECVNYDSYAQGATNFQDAASAYFIPSSAATCAAEVAGCSQFTNLDSVAAGGETSEYYSSLRRCIQPSNATCGAFYSWSGEGEAGYQLKAYSLEKNTDGTLKITKDDTGLCDESIFKLPVSSPDYNPDCRQFYNKDGSVSYHLYSRTVSCSADCRRLRLDETTTALDCENNGGDFASSTCIMQALPVQSTACTAEESGCREYNGNNGNNVRIVASYDFENGLAPFSFGTISNISTNKNGHSMALNGWTAVPMENIRQGAAYSLKFLAKGSGAGTNLRIYFQDAANNTTYFNSGVANNSIPVDDTEWRVYQVNIPNLKHRVSAGEKMYITSSDNSGNATTYLDSIVLTEITDRYYLIKDSWVTPDICYYDLNDEYRGAEYNLGCSAYQDPNGITHNLRQFKSLCDVSSAGCEAMIDTQNSKNPFSQNFASGNITVPGDQLIYAIFDSSKQCAASDIGCSRLGKGTKTGTNTFFSDIFIKNNPDGYDATLCQSSEVGCDTYYDVSGGKTFFRNPFGNTCQYRSSSNTGTETWGWFKSAVKRCDLNSNKVIDGTEKTTAVCASDSNCSAGTCIIDANDYPCDVSYLKTIGNDSGGAPQPSHEAGLCEASASTCSEYIDSSSEVAPNLIINPNFSDLDGNGTDGDLWPLVSGVPTQNIFLRAKKMYVVRSVSQTGAPVVNTLSCDNFNGSPVINTLGGNNQISTSTVASVQLKDDLGVYVIPKFDAACHITSNVDGSSTHAKSIEVREAVVDYQLESNLDSKTCGSKVDVDNGCVLFNNRAYNSAMGQVSSLDKNVFASPNAAGQAEGCTGDPASCNANTVLKVSPNRVCSRWLACTTKIKDESTGQDICYGLGECDRLSNTGECGNFIKTDNAQHNFSYANDKNSTGYQLLNAFYIANMQEVGNRTDWISPENFESGNFTFDKKITFTNTGSINSVVLGVTSPSLTTTGDYTLIDEPSPKSSAKRFSVSYPAEGRAFIGIEANKMLGKNRVTLTSGNDYYISYLVNTDSLTPGAAATVRVTDTGANVSNVLVEFNDKTNGWQRVVHRINVNKSVVSILFGTKQSNGVGGKVYYDDIKIEPVLKINNTGNDSKDYVAKECRLYPTEDSLTCSSHNENVIKSGLEGYCLQKDPINPGVCLQWLPIDTIASASISEKNAGYKGVYPLYYCSEANANFDLVENRYAFRVNGDGHTDFSQGDWCDSENQPQAGSFHDLDSSGNYNGFSCGSADYMMFYYEYNYHDNDSTHGCQGEYICVPKADHINVTVHFSHEGTYVVNYAYNDGAVTEAKKILSSQPSSVTGYRDGSTGGQDGFGIYYVVDSAGWYKFNGINGYQSTVKVYDYENPPANEDYLKLINDTDAEQNFTPVCNKFVKVVDENGNGTPWVDRLMNSDYGTNTPAFFPKISEFNYSSANPFNLAGKFFAFSLNSVSNYLYGAAVLSGAEVGSQSAIGFLTKYHANSSPDDKISLAGRPYGCFDNGHGSCSYLGYCSNAPELICLTYSGGGGANTAATCNNGGTCQPFGFKSETANNNVWNLAQKNVLKNIFLSSLGSFGLSSGRYVSDSSLGYDAKNAGIPYPIVEPCPGNVRPAANNDFGATTDSDFCAIRPEIKNVNLYRGNGSGPALQSVAAGTWKIEPGYYTLKFNSMVDMEQQPLGEIQIDWGDGQVDKINNQDSHPGTPHIVSHNYGYSSGVNVADRLIKIKITDNWGFYKVFP